LFESKNISTAFVFVLDHAVEEASEPVENPETPEDYRETPEHCSLRRKTNGRK
jgi:hypothetical protein